MTCIKCGSDNIGPIVSDDKWNSSVPFKYRTTLCKSCMDEYFEEEDYADSNEFDSILHSVNVRDDGVLELTKTQLLRLDELSRKLHPNINNPSIKEIAVWNNKLIWTFEDEK
jgi:hypothetical protein